MTDEASLRLDKWLWQARFFKTRGAAAAFCESGRLRLNRRTIAKPGAAVRPGDVLTFPHGDDIRVLRIEALGVRRGPAAEARMLYEPVATTPEAPPAAAP
jgi:ribosome-associated heat shock protein Hsp15